MHMPVSVRREVRDLLQRTPYIAGFCFLLGALPSPGTRAQLRSEPVECYWLASSALRCSSIRGGSIGHFYRG